MKYILFLGVFALSFAFAGFTFGECSGYDSFEQQINHYAGNYENTVLVGSIPSGIQGLRVELVSDNDVDIRLYGENNDKIVHWPMGLLNQSYLQTKNYNSVPITYSGYNGINGYTGHEFIEILGSTPTQMTMKAFGYSAGYATVNYSWTGKDNCTNDSNGVGYFEQEINHKSTQVVGRIPAGIENLEINLTSSSDLDIQLYGYDGTAIIKWPNGLLNQSGVQRIEYKGMHIEWSGYNGVAGYKGHEYIKLTGLTTEILTVKVYGYIAGYAVINYKWGNTQVDTLSPTISLLGSSYITVTQGDTYIDAGATATDNVDGNLTASIVINNPVNTSIIGTYIVTYDVNDTAGNSAEQVSRTVVVEENTIDMNLQPLVIIRIEFNDMSFTNNASIWSHKIYGLSEGTLNHYYNEISYGTFNFSKAIESNEDMDDGIITVFLNMNHPNPSNNLVSFMDEMKDALVLADDSIDFSQYDTNSDGAISRDELQIMFLVAGGESAVGENPGIWAHAWCMYGGNAVAPTHDGVKLMNCMDNGSYSLFAERHGTADATIGIMAHELGHAKFNIPDLYDSDGSSIGIGNFGLMGSGSWAYKPGDTAAGQTPVHMTGWSKIQSGFVVPEIINGVMNGLNLYASASLDYKLYKLPTGNNKEYFLIENRGASGYDMGLTTLLGTTNFTGGLSILHIDENKAGNTDENHKLVDVEEANNAGLDTKTNRGHINNLYFNGNADSFTDTTIPNSKRYDGMTSGVSVTNISQSASVMTADVIVQ